jgi:hypothetical protein
VRAVSPPRGRDVRPRGKPAPRARSITSAERIVVALAAHDPYVERRTWCFYCANGVGEKHEAGCLHLRAVACAARLGKGRS